jgi:hypothetical protein
MSPRHDRRRYGSFERKHQLSDMNDLAFLHMKLRHLALQRGGNFDRRFVRHDLAKSLIKFYRIARLNQPFNEFTFVDAFTELWKPELHTK